MNSITHLFEINEKKYAIDYINLIFCRLDDDIYEKLKRFCIDSNKSVEDCPSEVFAELFSRGYFVTDKVEAPIPTLHYDTLNISFAPIHSCNFSCKYCYADGGAATPNFGMQFDKVKIDDMLEYIYIKRYQTYQKYKFDFVSGGEPLLNITILEYFLFLLYQFIREKKRRKLYEEDPEAYNAMIEAEEKENPEAEAYEREMEEIEEYDADSGKGYCPHCGNYGVNSDKICESCGEKVTE